MRNLIIDYVDEFFVKVLYLCLFVLIIVCVIMVVYVKNPVYSVFFLVLVFILCVCILVLLNVEFIGIIFLVVYVGAIAVLFLFVIMMLNIRLVEMEQLYIRYLPVGLLFIFFLFFLFNYVLFELGFYESYNRGLFLWVPDYLSNTNINVIGIILYTYYLIEFMIAGIILLVAMIGTIVVTLNHKKNVRRQELYKQISREYYNLK